MAIVERLRSAEKAIKAELVVYRLVLADPRTPKLAKWLLGLTVAYAVSPIDLIPDFIPVVGYLDDLIVLPVLVIVALKMIPQEVMEDCRAKVLDT